MKTSSVGKNALILGLALFAMFFGAGNLIFPPVIGLEGGTDWIIGYITYFIADVGLAIVSILAMLKAQGSMDAVSASIGRVPSVILNVAILVCVGPLLAIPRTATTSFEMGTSALFGSSLDSPLILMCFSVVFMGTVYVLSMSPGKVVSYIGKILTPVLVIALAVLIIGGVTNPAAQTAAPSVTNLIEEGVLNGYQTMDVIAALAFSIVIVATVKNFNYAEAHAQTKTVAIACAVSAALLLVVYGGLAYLGATTGQLWADGFADGTVNQAQLLAQISNAILGRAGALFLAITVLFACLTTSIGLVSSCSQYFYGLFRERFSYRLIALVICVISLLVCNLGLSQIISISAPILSLVYPVVLFLVVAYLCRPADTGTQDTGHSASARAGAQDAGHSASAVASTQDTGHSARAGAESTACKCGAIVALLVSLCGILADTFNLEFFQFIHTLPLDSFGLGWIIPTVAAFILGLVIERLLLKK